MAFGSKSQYYLSTLNVHIIQLGTWDSEAVSSLAHNYMQ